MITDGGLHIDTSVTGICERLAIGYLVALLFFYPYGIPVGEEGGIRVPDVIALGTIFFAGALLCIRGHFRMSPLVFLPLLPFLLFELATPLLGAVGYGSPSGIANSLRMVLIWFPLLLVAWSVPLEALGRLDTRVRKILKLAIWANLIYGAVQYLVMFGLLSEMFILDFYLEAFALDRHYRAFNTLRASGFFINTTALAVFSVICIAYFAARYVAHQKRRDLQYALLAFALTIITTSRAALFGVALIFGVVWCLLPGRKKMSVLLGGSTFIVLLLALISQLVSIDEFFHRFSRLAEVGMLGDSSFAVRYYEYWPRVLHDLQEYPWGTLESAPAVLGLIDSGYLTYYAQGKWAFIAALVFLLAGLLIQGLHWLRGHRQWARVMLLCVGVFLTGAMITTNPMRAPTIVFFLIYGCWLLHYQRVQAKSTRASAVIA